MVQAEERQWSTALQSYRALITLLSAHLRSITSCTEEAAVHIMERLQDIEQQLRVLNQSVRASWAGGESHYRNQRARLDAANGVLAKHGSKVAELATFLAKRTEESALARGRLQGLVRSAVELASNAECIEGIARQTSILALNARIEAARAGQHAGSFAVVANEVKALAEESRRAVEQISQSVVIMRTSLSAELSRQEAEDAQTRERLAAQGNIPDMLLSWMKQMGEAYQELHQKHADLLQKLAESTEAINRQAAEMLAEIQFQDITRQRIEAVQHALADLEKRLSQMEDALSAPAGAPCEAPDLGIDLEEIMKHYAMHKQRQDHQSALGTEAEETDGPDVELF
jgi:methyl-accepting chemotaxis protein